MKKVLLRICFLAYAAAVMAGKDAGRVSASETKGQMQEQYGFPKFQVLSLLQTDKEKKVELNLQNFRDPAVLEMAQRYDRDGDGALNEEEREIVSMHVSGGMSFREIASFMDLNLSTVLSKYHRSVKKMKQMIREVTE